MKGEYNQKFNMSIGEIMAFPDFELEFVDREATSADSQNKTNNSLIFKVIVNNIVQTIKWTPSAELLSALNFTANGKNFSFQPWVMVIAEE